MAAKTLIVISDLHVGAGQLDDCDDELEGHFVDFLIELSQRASAVELVINGDFLDFAQAPPWSDPDLESESASGIPLCFTQRQSIEKLKAIARAHPNIFMALGTLLSSKADNELTILPGNHDADFFWEGVRNEFVDTVCDGNPSLRRRVRFHLEAVYRPTLFPETWIEHGHQYDSVNSFFVENQPRWSEKNPPILLDRYNRPRLYECIGTRFLIRYLNDLDAEYPFVDNVKPFWRFLQLFGTSALTPGFGPLKAAFAVSEMLAVLASSLATRPEDVLELDPGQPSTTVGLLLHAYEVALPDKRRAFTEAIVQRGFPVDRPLDLLLADPDSSTRLLAFLADHLELLDHLDQPEDTQTLALTRAFVVEETHELSKNANRVLGDSNTAARIVVMGHTHETVNQDPPCYINTGSWTRYYQFARQERLHPWSLLRSRSYERFPYELNLALIQPCATPAAQLATFARKDKDGNA